jgi:hypothetical protein
MTLSLRRRNSQRGSSLVEMAIFVPFLTLAVGITMVGGIGFNRALTARQAARNANVLMIRNFDLSTPEAQSLVVRSARGLGMEMGPSDFRPNPNGKATVYLSHVVRVGPLTCAAGIPNYPTSPCPNEGKYIIRTRIVIGNASRWTSAVGTVTTAGRDSKGRLDDHDVADHGGNEAIQFDQKFTAGSTPLDHETFVAEVFADTGDFNFFPTLANVPHIFVFNVS